MNGATRTKSREELAAGLRRDFTDGFDWPLDRASLSALVDLGLSDANIADYFGVPVDDVETHRERMNIERSC